MPPRAFPQSDWHSERVASTDSRRGDLARPTRQQPLPPLTTVVSNGPIGKSLGTAAGPPAADADRPHPGRMRRPLADLKTCHQRPTATLTPVPARRTLPARGLWEITRPRFAREVFLWKTLPSRQCAARIAPLAAASASLRPSTRGTTHTTVPREPPKPPPLPPLPPVGGGGVSGAQAAPKACWAGGHTSSCAVASGAAEKSGPLT